jgi:paraquat-inducible protein A
MNMTINLRAKTDRELIVCHSCRKVFTQQQVQSQGTHCSRCGDHLHLRKPGGTGRVWALLIASAVLYIPANLLPITLTSSIAGSQADTIISGVIYFMWSGSWHIALIIFVASVFVPLVKLLTLAYLCFSIRNTNKISCRDRTRLYRLTEIVGRWSMIDVYVVCILVALVKLGAIANIDAGPGVIYFALVVIFTMVAAHSFDPRWIWDAQEEE